VSDDNTARVWDAMTGAELLQLNGSTGPVGGLAVTPDGARIVTGASDTTAWVSALAQLRPQQQYQADSPLARQAIVDRGKTIVPRCLTVQQRRVLALAPKPPGWCIDMGKYPYDGKHWKAWKAGKPVESIDSSTASTYGDFSDAALKAGDFQVALEAAELGIMFDPGQIWIVINRAHAYMFLGRIHEARREYLAHRGQNLDQGLWEQLVIKDFEALREKGREHPLMKEIEGLFKPSLDTDEAHK